MDELFEQILVFIPVALLIFVRLFMEAGKKKREEAKRAGQGDASTRKSGKPENIEELFSSLFGASKGPVETLPTGGLAGTAYGTGRVHYDELPVRPKPTASVSAPKQSPLAEQTSVHEAERPGRSPEARAEGEPRAAANRSSAERLAALTPLQRALVMAEVLGKPRSLRDEAPGGLTGL